MELKVKMQSTFEVLFSQMAIALPLFPRLRQMLLLITALMAEFLIALALPVGICI